MNDMTPFQGLEVGYDIPALPGMAEAEIQTPCLVPRPRRAGAQHQEDGRLRQGATGCVHRVHGKMHKSMDVAKLQVRALAAPAASAAKKVSEAEVFARGGIKDVLVSNQVRDPAKIDRLARMPKLGARTICCVDDVGERGRPLCGGGQARYPDRVPRGDRLRRGPLRGDDNARGCGRSPRRSTPRRVSSSPAYRPTRARCSTWIAMTTARPRSTSRWPW